MLLHPPPLHLHDLLLLLVPEQGLVIVLLFSWTLLRYFHGPTWAQFHFQVSQLIRAQLHLHLLGHCEEVLHANVLHLDHTPPGRLLRYLRDMIHVTIFKFTGILLKISGKKLGLGFIYNWFIFREETGSIYLMID